MTIDHYILLCAITYNGLARFYTSLLSTFYQRTARVKYKNSTGDIRTIVKEFENGLIILNRLLYNVHIHEYLLFSVLVYQYIRATKVELLTKIL